MPRTSRRNLIRAAGLGGATAMLPAPAGAAGAAQATYRPVYHFSVPDHWKNDPQRPIRIDGKTHYYYLYNKDYPAPGTGTSWRLVASDDNVAFDDLGTAIAKEENPNGSIWSGCLVVDEDDTAGFGAGAVIALATQEDRTATAPNRQAQFLFHSTDGGRTFERHEPAVLPNPGVVDFRDPKVIWDAERSQWVMALAEGDKIGFYVSADLKGWTYTDGFIKQGIGVIECPDLFWMASDNGPGRWVLGASANTKGSGGPATYAYWTGEWNGTAFVADQADPKWLDHGWDWYGAVTWERWDGGAVDPRTRYAIGWMNHWDYADKTPSWEADGFNGTDSIVREIALHWHDDEAVLLSTPVRTLADRAFRTVELGNVTVDGHAVVDYRGRAYEVRARVTWDQVNNIGFQLRRSDDGLRHIDAGVYAAGGYAYLNRGNTPNPDARWTESRTPFDSGPREVDLRILVDNLSAEVFIDDGRYVHTSLVFPDPAHEGLALFTDGGPAVFNGLTVTEFAPIA
ncbi:glycoside hydrolase family 32 protein [Glycomyces harbinensis]|uniref:Levanbiose-producing levanase n=1 Tax=Glycomyces harbinensis TaxID=58114 RepID=A0A1G6XZ59_9ACTN|nr:GH32 C-terminal domain-containing protein [Glycomyces harbinensis]SDD83458.1 levanbiose-producing levanase [Glycomyces harbinensis]